MEHSKSPRPFYQRFTLSLLAIVLLCVALSFGKIVILPVLFAILLANLLLPATRTLARRNWYRPFSILAPLTVTVLIGATLVFFLSTQVISFLDDLPALETRFDELYLSVQKWVRENAHITIKKQNEYLTRGVENLQDQVPQLLGMTLSSILEIANYVFLVPIYTFLILYYRDNIKSFLVGTFKNGSEDKVKEVLNESSAVAQHYMLGLLIETSFVFTLNLIGFMIIGVKYKVLLALLAALLNLIPYIGMIIANILCMLSTVVTSDNPTDALWVGVVLALVQVIDNNFGMPLIVGSKVRINGLVMIIGVISGGALCGIPGMFLAIPGIAVLKIIFDNVGGLKPWGVLLGDEREKVREKKPRMVIVNQNQKTANV